MSRDVRFGLLLAIRSCGGRLGAAAGVELRGFIRVGKPL